MNRKVRDWISRLARPSLVLWPEALPSSWPFLVPTALFCPVVMVGQLVKSLRHPLQPAELCIPGPQCWIQLQEARKKVKDLCFRLRFCDYGRYEDMLAKGVGALGPRHC
jgi:hypothetical protein